MEWAKNQSWYKNTVIVIYGDHISRVGFVRRMAKSQNYQRATYNVIINSGLKPGKRFERKITACDLMPTILAAAGIKIKEEKLGVGVNLFSDESTHYEKIEKKFTGSLSDTAHWYDTEVLKRFTPCLSLKVNKNSVYYH